MPNDRKGGFPLIKKLFKKKENKIKQVILSAPVKGKFLPLEEVPDPVFSEKMMGDGVAIDPEEGKIVAPADGEVVQIFPTKHAVGLKIANGAEILIHIGLETVNLKGEGFTAHVKEGQKVKMGELLVTFDIDQVKEKARSMITPMIVTNGEDMQSVERLVKEKETQVLAGMTDVLEVYGK